MASPERRLRMSVEDYLEFEAKSAERHEFIDGHICAMSGASLRHNRIASNVHLALKQHLQSGPCESFISDVKVRVKQLSCFYYPDVMVVCGERSDESLFVDDPVLIVEVLSRSTAAIDKREKLFAYEKIEALSEYMIVHQSAKRADLYRKGGDGRFILPEQITTGRVELVSMPGSLQLSFDDVYAGVDFDGDGADQASPRVLEMEGVYSW